MVKQAQITAVYWGIGRDGVVDHVQETKKGSSIDLINSKGFQHSVDHGRSAKAEVAIVFGLREIKRVHVDMLGTEFEERIIADLEEKAKGHD